MQRAILLSTSVASVAALSAEPEVEVIDLGADGAIDMDAAKPEPADSASSSEPTSVADFDNEASTLEDELKKLEFGDTDESPKQGEPETAADSKKAKTDEESEAMKDFQPKGRFGNISVGPFIGRRPIIVRRIGPMDSGIGRFYRSLMMDSMMPSFFSSPLPCLRSPFSGFGDFDFDSLMAAAKNGGASNMQSSHFFSTITEGGETTQTIEKRVTGADGVTIVTNQRFENNELVENNTTTIPPAIKENGEENESNSPTPESETASPTPEAEAAPTPETAETSKEEETANGVETTKPSAIPEEHKATVTDETPGDELGYTPCKAHELD